MELQVLFLTSFLCLTYAQIYNGCDYSVLYRHPANCHQYLQCSNGYEYIMNCNEDLVFNEKMQYCDWDYNVPECSEGTTTTTSIMTTTKSNCVEVGAKCSSLKVCPKFSPYFRFAMRLWILLPQPL